MKQELQRKGISLIVSGLNTRASHRRNIRLQRAHGLVSDAHNGPLSFIGVQYTPQSIHMLVLARVG